MQRFPAGGPRSTGRIREVNQTNIAKRKNLDVDFFQLLPLERQRGRRSPTTTTPKLQQARRKPHGCQAMSGRSAGKFR